jgi:hypothetical protein
MSFLLLLIFTLQWKWRKQVLPGREGEGRGGWGQGQQGEMTQTMYAHVNKLILKNLRNGDRCEFKVSFFIELLSCLVE